MITVASRRPNPSSLSDSKGRCVYKDAFFLFSLSPYHPQRVCGMMLVSWNNTFVRRCAICVILVCTCVCFSLRNAMCCVYLSLPSATCNYPLVLFAFFAVFLLSPLGFTQPRPIPSARIQTHRGNEHLPPPSSSPSSSSPSPPSPISSSHWMLYCILFIFWT